MKLEMEVSQQGEQALLDFSRATGRSIADVLRQTARGASRDLLALTPPSDANNPKASFALQRAAGEKAVRQDIEQLFPTIDELSLLERPQSEGFAEALRGGIRRGDAETVRTLLSRAGVVSEGSSRVMVEPSPDVHRSARDGRGKVKRQAKRWPRYIISKSRRAQYVRARVAAVGTLMAGFVAGALRYGVKGIPRWVTRHRQHGSVQSRETRVMNPEIVIRNPVDYASTHNARGRITKMAIGNALSAIRRQLDARLRGDWRRRR